MATKYCGEELLGRAFLSAVHEHVSAVLARIEAIQAEICEQKRSVAEPRSEVREQTKAWADAHPAEIEAIADLLDLPNP